jgi:uncharacterized membrane protein (UPF0127 family)
MLRRSVLASLILVIIFSAAHGEEKVRKVCFKDTCVRAEIAASEEERKTGLMFRESLGEGEGMLFVNKQEGIYTFWMKNMRFPIDIIWIGKDKQVVFMANNALPCKEDCQTISPDAPARYILEVKAGFINKNRVKIGDKVDF